MKKAFPHIACAVALLLLAACGKSDAPEVEFVPVRPAGSTAWSLLAPDGRTVLDQAFADEPTVVVDGVFSVQEANGIALYKLDAEKGKPVKVADGLIGCGAYTEGLVPVVRPQERIAFVDRNGKTLFTLDPVNGKEIVRCAPAFSDGMLAIVDEDGKIGYIDPTGRIAIEPRYDRYLDFAEGLAGVCLRESEEADALVYSLIDKNGSAFKAFPQTTALFGTFRHGRIVAKQGNTYGFVDKKGHFSPLPKNIEEILDFNADFLIYRAGKRCGVMTIDGNTVLQPLYDVLYFHGADRFLAGGADGKYTLFDKTGRRVQTFDGYAGIASMRSVWSDAKIALLAGEEEKFRLLDDQGKPVADPFYSGLGTRRSISDVLTSDRFNIGLVARQLVDCLEPAGIGGIALGQTGETFLTGPVRTADDTMFPFNNGSMYPCVARDGNGYTLRGYAVTRQSFIKPLAGAKPAAAAAPADSLTSLAAHSWNPSAKVDRLALGVQLENDGRAADLHSAVEKRLTAAGYSLAYSNLGFSILKKGDVDIAIEHRKDGNLLRVYMLPAQDVEVYATGYTPAYYGYASEESDNAPATPAKAK